MWGKKKRTARLLEVVGLREEPTGQVSFLKKNGEWGSTGLLVYVPPGYVHSMLGADPECPAMPVTGNYDNLVGFAIAFQAARRAEASPAD